METTSYQNQNYGLDDRDKTKTYLSNENFYTNTTDAAKKGSILDSNTSKIWSNNGRYRKKEKQPNATPGIINFWFYTHRNFFSSFCSYCYKTS